MKNIYPDCGQSHKDSRTSLPLQLLPKQTIKSKNFFRPFPLLCCPTSSNTDYQCLFRPRLLASCLFSFNNVGRKRNKNIESHEWDGGRLNVSRKSGKISSVSWILILYATESLNTLCRLEKVMYNQKRLSHQEGAKKFKYFKHFIILFPL